jgi:hypothetical protein
MSGCRDVGRSPASCRLPAACAHHGKMPWPLCAAERAASASARGGRGAGPWRRSGILPLCGESRKRPVTRGVFTRSPRRSRRGGAVRSARLRRRPGCQDVRMSGCREVGMSGGREVGMSGGRDVGRSPASCRLPAACAHHGKMPWPLCAAERAASASARGGRGAGLWRRSGILPLCGESRKRPVTRGVFTRSPRRSRRGGAVRSARLRRRPGCRDVRMSGCRDVRMSGGRLPPASCLRTPRQDAVATLRGGARRFSKRLRWKGSGALA